MDWKSFFAHIQEGANGCLKHYLFFLMFLPFVLMDFFLFFLRYQESVQVLSWLEELSYRENNVIGKACLISSCLDLMLYAGKYWQLVTMLA